MQLSCCPPRRSQRLRANKQPAHLRQVRRHAQGSLVCADVALGWRSASGSSSDSGLRVGAGPLANGHQGDLTALQPRPLDRMCARACQHPSLWCFVGTFCE